MRLFQMKAILGGVNMMEVYLEDKYVSFGWEGLGDLEQVSQKELTNRRLFELQSTKTNQPQWLSQWEEIHTFVYDMQDGDYVIVTNEGIAHIGDLGDYYYVHGLESAEINSCHRRGVTWLKSVPIGQLSSELQSFVNQIVNVSAYDQPTSQELIEQWISGGEQPDRKEIEVSILQEEIIQEALSILVTAMRSDDLDRRERAASAILQYARR